MRVLTLPLVIGALIVSGCGSEKDSGPKGTPTAVLSRAPRITAAEGRAHVSAAGPGVEADGTVDLGAGTSQVRVEGTGDEVSPFLRDPVLVLDLVRGVVDIDPFGGLQVRAVGTIMYEVDIDPAKVLQAAPANRRARLARLLPDEPFYADVFVDTQGRIRRVLLPVDLSTPRQYGDSKITNEEMTVDFYDFASESK